MDTQNIKEFVASEGFDFEDFEDSVKDLLTGKVEWYEVTEFLKQVIEFAEHFYPGASNEEEKKQFIMSLWDYFDDKYNLVDKLDELVDFTKFFGKIVGTLLETWDSKAIRAIIEDILIPALVALII